MNAAAVAVERLVRLGKRGVTSLGCFCPKPYRPRHLTLLPTRRDYNCASCRPIYSTRCVATPAT